MNGLLPASILPGLLETALKSRVNVQSLFESAGIDADIVGRQDRFISLEQLDTLLSTAFGMAEDPWFGLSVGRENHYGNLDLLGNLMATSDTLGDAMELLLRYKDLLVPYLQFDLDVVDDRARITSTSDESLNFTRTRTHNEVVVATMVSIGRSLLGGEMGLRRVLLRHQWPPDPEPYREFFGVPVECGRPCNGVEFDRDRLDVPLPTAFPKYNQRLRRLAEQQLAELNRARGVVGQVLAMLSERLGRDEIGIAAIAAQLHVTPRTLQRRLRREGTTYASLRDRVRHERACRRLSGERCDMEELARALGFSDTANFYHAFRRWEGCAPGAYRRRIREQASGA